ncbi:hypothetical protein HMPREF3034_00275 [Prevotella sp. DNF00663]|uniref:DUF6078 family protein n=1 Tax=unclassified Prevotella TaxID=2638335 RepID=UPI0006902BB0|nr:MULTISPECIES: DUF6078 family protein [unclassified Prevotella]KXB85286.1 hypothetical protein HMPREF3034_00275 [Prevotella sp. DNF00663]
MKTTTNQRPADYVVCMLTEGKCALSASCLRSKMFAANVDEKQTYMHMLNPYALADGLSGTPCTYYRSAQKQQLARGMLHIFDNVPRKIYPEVRRAVMDCFSSYRQFYYCRKGEKLISPSAQNAVMEVFKRYRLDTEHLFDAYEEGFDW